MTRNEILASLQEIFQDVFDDGSLSIDESMTSDDVNGWDSLSQIELIMTIEGEFSVKFSIEDAMEMHTVGDIVNHIEERI